jgi:transcriptional regulator with XRE-family HTH domain
VTGCTGQVKPFATPTSRRAGPSPGTGSAVAERPGSSGDDACPSSGTDEGKPDPPTLADKVNRLFSTVKPAGRREYSNQDVANALAEQGSAPISATYIWQLRKGLRDNPTKRHLEALAQFFGVPPAYFFDDAAGQQIAAELDLLAAMRDAGVRQVAQRTAGLSPAGLDVIHSLVEHVRELEGLSISGQDQGASGHAATTEIARQGKLEAT